MAENSILEAQLLEAAMETIQSHVKSGALKPGDIMEKLGSNDGVDSTMVLQVNDSKRDAEYVTVYSTKDGMPSEVLVNMLAKILQKRFGRDPEVPARLHGQRAFSLTPVVEYRASETPLLCYFHPEAPERGFMDTHGLKTRTCRKANLPTEFDRLMHAQHRHRAEFKAYEAARAEETAREYREQQAQMLEAQRAMIEAIRDTRTAEPAKRGSAKEE